MKPNYKSINTLEAFQSDYSNAIVDPKTLDFFFFFVPWFATIELRTTLKRKPHVPRIPKWLVALHWSLVMPPESCGLWKNKGGIKVGHMSHVTQPVTSHFSTKLVIKGLFYLHVHPPKARQCQPGLCVTNRASLRILRRHLLMDQTLANPSFQNDVKIHICIIIIPQQVKNVTLQTCRQGLKRYTSFMLMTAQDKLLPQ